MRHVVNLLLLAVVVTLGLVAMELVTRKLPMAQRLGWNLVPPLSDRIAEVSDKTDVERVVVVGDSFAEWMDTSGGNFVRVAERRMRDQGRKVEFVNMGQAGTGMAEYYRNLVDHAAKLKPDTVILALYVGNDLVAFPGGLPKPDEARRVLPTAQQDRSWRKTLKQSILLNLLYRQAKVHVPWLRSGFTDGIVEYLRTHHRKDHDYVRQRLAKLDPQLVQEAESDSINGWDLATALFSPDYYGNLADADAASPEGSAALASLADLGTLVRYAKTLAPQVMVVLIPPSPWAGERYHDYFRRLGYGQLGPTQTEPVILTRVKAALDQENTPYLDLLPALRDSSDAAYMDRDIHFNTIGQELAGRQLARALGTP
ncbi:MAG: SGNH/GDSL hydrolase family protein [Magnetospirillum sp.]|nr:SGNH/GDSL hydrolase family protein [Magnetospirillum sp.]